MNTTDWAHERDVWRDRATEAETRLAEERTAHRALVDAALRVGMEVGDRCEDDGSPVKVPIGKMRALGSAIPEYAFGPSEQAEGGKPVAAEITKEDLPDYIGEKEAAALSWLRTHSVMPHPDSRHSRVLMDLLEKCLQGAISAKTEGRKDG